MKFLQAFLFLVLSNLIIGQTYEWAYSAGLHRGECIAVDNNDNIICMTAGTGNYGSPTFAVTDKAFHLAKHSPNGTLQWTVGFEVGGLNSISVDNSGSIFLTGMNYSHGKFYGVSTSSIVTFSPQGDAFVAKYTAAGEIEWVKTYGDLDSNIRVEGVSVKADYSGGCYIAGNHTRNGTGPQTSKSFISKYAWDGTLIWNSSSDWMPPTGIILKGIDLQIGGDIIVGGSFVGTLKWGTNIINTPATISSIILARFSPLGVLRSLNNIGSSDWGYINALHITNRGEICLGGIFKSPSNFGGINLTSPNSSGMFVVKLDSNLNGIWGKSSIGQVWSLTSDAYGNCYATGSYYKELIFSGSSSKLQTAQSKDLFVVKFNENGEPNWMRSSDGKINGFDESLSVAINKLGKVIITGAFELDTKLDAFQLLAPSSPWNRAQFIAILSNPDVATEITAKQSKNFASITIYPIPATNSITVKILNSPGGCQMTISNIIGQTLLSKSLENKQEECVELVNLNFFPGVYFISLSTNNFNEIRKIIIE
jgi:hypothetical protein